uniref:Uncharacterized protein n=1 Tax=Cacopsylla melanoneura TaxID=428564 RepID=A0A8D8SLV7_9HEMI
MSEPFSFPVFLRISVFLFHDNRPITIGPLRVFPRTLRKSICSLFRLTSSLSLKVSMTLSVARPVTLGPSSRWIPCMTMFFFRFSISRVFFSSSPSFFISVTFSSQASTLVLSSCTSAVSGASFSSMFLFTI